MQPLGLIGLSLGIFLILGCGEKNIDSASNSVTSEQTQAELPGRESDNVAEATESEPPGAEELTSLQAVYFDFDKFTINSDMKLVIEQNAQLIKDRSLKSVYLHGNTDEFGTDEYNFALGLKRAIAVKDALILRGVDPKILFTVSYGKSKPVCQESTRACYSKNRRTDLVVK